MNSRERIKAILNKEIPDCMGLYEHYWGETLNDPQYWQAQGFPAGVNPELHFDYDIVGCGGWLNLMPFPDRRDILEETDEWQIIRDGRGARLKTWKHKSGTPEHIGFEVTSPEKWKEYREPLLETNPARLGDLAVQKKSLEEMKAKGKYTIYGGLFVFEQLRGMIGDEEFLPALLTDPEWITDFCQVYLDAYLRYYDLLFRESGIPDGFFTYEDFGYTNGLFCSPKVLKDLIMPFQNEWVGFLKSYGIQTIVHSCGNVSEAVPLLIDAGYDCLQPMEAKSGMNVLELARTYGNKMAYMGNIDATVLTTNDKEKIREEILPKLDGLREMRIPYVFHSDHSIPPNVSMETYEYALGLFRGNNRY